MESTEVKFLYLSQEDMKKAGVLDMHKCVEVIDEAIKLMAKDDYLFGGLEGNEHGIGIFFPKTARGPRMPVAGPDRRFMAMVGYLGGEFNVCGGKLYGSNQANRERGLPRSILMVILNDPDTGAPLAVTDGNLISAMRTGAIQGVGAKYLAREDSEVIGIIGAGVINRPCLMALAEVLKKVKEVKVFDLVKSQSQAFSDEMGGKLGLNVYPVDSLEEAIKNSDVISFAASRGKTPFVKNEWLKEGSYIGRTAPTDFQDDCYLTCRIVADNWKMHRAWKMHRVGQKVINAKPEEIRGETAYLAAHRLFEAGRIKVEELGAIALGTKPGRINDKEKIMLLAGGLPIEDIAWGYTVYKEAIKKGIGQELTLWKKPFWV